MHDPCGRADPESFRGEIAIRNVVLQQALQLGTRCDRCHVVSLPCCRFTDGCVGNPTQLVRLAIASTGKSMFSRPFLQVVHQRAPRMPIAELKMADASMERGRVVDSGPLHNLQPIPSASADDRHGDCSPHPKSVAQRTRMPAMPIDFHDIDPNRVAAIIYRSEDDVDTLLADFAETLVRSGERIGGIVQRNVKDSSGRQVGMQAIDLMTGREISICQPLGSGAMACKLDAAGLAEAALAVTRAIAADVDLVVINKFSKQEAAGEGLRDELADAVAAGIPVLTAVPDKCLEAWNDFTDGIGTSLLCERSAIEGWWQDLSARITRTRAMRLPSEADLLADHHVG
ncbi:MAG: DUF2478 domain-containing protein [Bradyrhizobiaceae bacterium]|nr:MAG: DUF2478 domain-containing protein [Bradyrhizobiaceae bacterium]